MGDGFVDVTEILRCGVYVLRNRGTVVYVGQSKAMLTRVYTHRNLARKKAPPWLKTAGVVFDEVLVMAVHPDRLDAVERELIARYQPKHNQAHKPLQLPTTPSVGRRPAFAEASL